jgi:transposase
LDRLIEQLQFAHRQALLTTRQIRALCHQDPELRSSITLLQTMPGIGWITASHLVARIGDWRNMHNVRQLGAFLGCVPIEHSTGDVVNRGPISRTGDTRLRNKLVQAAWVAIRRDPELRAFYQRIWQRHPKDRAAKKAIVAVTRKLTTRIYAVLHGQRPYVIRGGSQEQAPSLMRRTAPGDASTRSRTEGAA